MRQQGHVRLEGRSWRLYFRTGEPRRQVSARLGDIHELPNKSAARRAADRLLEQLAPRQFHAGSVVSWPQWCRTYEARFLSLLAKSSRTTRISILNRHLVDAPQLATRAVQEIDAEICQELILAWHAAGAAPSTCRARLSLVRAILNAATEAGLATRAIAWPRIRLPRDQGAPVAIRTRAFSADDCARILAAASDPLLTAVGLARYAGLRAGEICGLVWDDIELEQGRLHVRQQAQDGRLVPLKTSAAAAVLAPPAPLVALLRAYRTTWTPNDAGLLFAAPDGRPLDPAVLRKQLHKLLDQLGIARKGLHAFRHRCAISMAEASANPEALRRALRHRSLRSTMVYLAAGAEDVAAALAAGAAT